MIYFRLEIGAFFPDYSGAFVAADSVSENFEATSFDMAEAKFFDWMKKFRLKHADSGDIRFVSKLFACGQVVLDLNECIKIEKNRSVDSAVVVERLRAAVRSNTPCVIETDISTKKNG